jgi:hypothetical protein
MARAPCLDGEPTSPRQGSLIEDCAAIPLSPKQFAGIQSFLFTLDLEMQKGAV